MTARPNTAGQPHPTARHHALPEAQRNSSSLAVDPSFPRSPLAQTVIDVVSVLFLFLFALTFGFAVTAAIFILLFVGI